VRFWDLLIHDSGWGFRLVVPNGLSVSRHSRRHNPGGMVASGARVPIPIIRSRPSRLLELQKRDIVLPLHRHCQWQRSPIPTSKRRE
jgi:hypothetical protein